MNQPKIINAQKWLSRLTALTLICGAVVASMYSYSAFIEDPYLYFRNLPFPVKEKVYAGGGVDVEIAHCNRSGGQKVYETTRSLRNELTGQSESIQSNTVSVDPGCHVANNRIIQIPSSTAPGKYSIWGVALLNGYAIQRKVVWYSESFEVLPPKPPPTQGPPGRNGVDGAKGAKGATGKAGADGTKGEPGANGKSFWGNK